MSDRAKSGTAARRRVLGDVHVDASRTDSEAWETPFIDLISEAAWGHVWARGTISDRERSMMTLALLAGLGNIEEFKLHLKATARTGTSRGDVLEALLHVAIYAGVPRANHAIKVAKEVFREMEAEL